VTAGETASIPCHGGGDIEEAVMNETEQKKSLNIEETVTNKEKDGNVITEVPVNDSPENAPTPPVQSDTTDQADGASDR
jgi:hypothetical protein